MGDVIKVFTGSGSIDFDDRGDLDLTKQIEVLKARIADLESIEETHRMRYLFRTEIDFFAKKNKLKILNQFNWLEFQNPDFLDLLSLQYNTKWEDYLSIFSKITHQQAHSSPFYYATYVRM